ncbi:HpcH/HpaI aldolase family protein [Sphingobium tyrosinilyticum]|uniref:HpcH/HpaI aldolase/citrate lyase family protein n=1 Tax=Sphingobium tyrosinilyticum TaxID=2715436 RepID=A0ABV9F193_9SPHN
MTARTMDPILDSIAAGERCFGLWISIPDRLSIETVGKAGYDFLILDGQHGGIGWDAVLPAIQTLDLNRAPAFVRVRANDPGLIMRALDLGARGVIVPLVNDSSQAARAARATRYPPDGDRSYGPVRGYHVAGVTDALRPLCFVMIETVEAMSNLAAIAATPGIDGLFVGPVDLGLSMGFDVEAALAWPSAVMEAVEKVVAVCARHKLVAGCPAFGMDNARALAERGVQFLPLGADVGLLRRAAAADLTQAHSWTR